jgi:hypothetical protein
MYAIKSRTFTMGDDFYVTLPSNGASKVYPRNRPTCYRTDLNLGRKLLSGWEVGLSQIQFTRNWNEATPEFTFMVWVTEFSKGYNQNIPTSRRGVLERRLLNISAARVTHNETVDGVTTITKARSRMVTIPAYEQWKHVDELGWSVSEAIERVLGESGSNLFTVRYVRNSDNTASFTVKERGVPEDSVKAHLGFSSEDDELFQILGISPRRESSLLANKKLRVYGFREDLLIPRSNGFPSLETIFVYSDICEEQVIGDQRGQLLKLVPVTVKKGERQCNEYPRPTYVQVMPTSLPNIEISIHDRTGREVQIWDENSFVTTVLHFRRRKVSSAADAGWC